MTGINGLREPGVENLPVRRVTAMRSAAGPFCLSGIVVTTIASQFPDVENALATLPGVDVHYRDEARGRLVVVQEASSIDDEIEAMRRIQSLPGVVDASLVCHYFGGDAEPGAPMLADAAVAGDAEGSHSIARPLESPP